MPRISPLLVSILLVFFGCLSTRSVDTLLPDSAKRAETSNQGVIPADRATLAQIVREAFLATHDGWSTDEVLLDDQRNARFLARCRERLPEVTDTDCNWALLNLRKAGSLGPVVTKRRHGRHDNHRHAAEIAARLMQDQYGMNMDRVLCDQEKRQEFARIALDILPPDSDINAYHLRKAALRLRKNRQLAPELVLRVADWDREILTFTADEIRRDVDLVPPRPGIYMFRDDSGYLYIGESQDLRERVGKHLDRSDRVALASYLWGQGVRRIMVELHVFDPQSKARLVTVRRAYESELIRTRRPRFNVRP